MSKIKDDIYVKEMEGIIMDEVESSNIHSIGYQRAVRGKDKALYVRFKGGVIWKYLNVPKGVYFDLMAAPSVGSFFSSMIKPAYDGVKVYPIDEDA